MKTLMPFVEGDDEVITQLTIAAKAMVASLSRRAVDSSPDLQSAAVKLMAYWYDHRGLMMIGCQIDPVPDYVRNLIMGARQYND